MHAVLVRGKMPVADVTKYRCTGISKKCVVATTGRQQKKMASGTGDIGPCRTPSAVRDLPGSAAFERRKKTPTAAACRRR